MSRTSNYPHHITKLGRFNVWPGSAIIISSSQVDMPRTEAWAGHLPSCSGTFRWRSHTLHKTCPYSIPGPCWWHATSLSGWCLSHPSEKIWVRQLGWWNSMSGKTRIMFQSTHQFQYPLVNVYITMERSTMLWMGKLTHFQQLCYSNLYNPSDWCIQ